MFNCFNFKKYSLLKAHSQKKRILVAPLNWGLGHATRCIPIINALIALGFEPIIASDGVALELLKKEFPEVKTFALPSYNITYPKKATGFKLKLIKDSPHLLKTIKKEKAQVEALVENENISGIISDNRFGVRAKGITSIFITHQLRVLSGSTTWLSSTLHQNIIKKFDQCWVPDYEGESNLSGDLGHIEDFKIPIKYIGALSRFERKNLDTKFDLFILLSGPEPQRTYLEEKLLSEIEHFEGQVLFVKGKIENQQTRSTIHNTTIYNFMTSLDLENTLNQSKFILSRSGYTTIMDLAKLGKKAFFIPTPGQFEQEYLARKLTIEGIAPSCEQKDFKISKLKEIENYSGFKSTESEYSEIKDLLGFF